MSIDPYHPTLDENPHSPLPAKPDPLGPGQVELNPQRVPGHVERRPMEREHDDAELVIGEAEPAERGAPPSAR